MLLFGFVVSALVLVHAVQLPLQPSYEWQDTPILNGDKPTTWRLDETPHPNATDHLVFETVYSLLQHWPNTRMRNGHNIVPGTIPEGTLLYHSTDREAFPPGPEWVALDPEHAYYYCHGQMALGRPRPQQGCWQLTLTTTRPLKVVYFDGKSAAKVPGPLDTQDLLAFGESSDENMWDETERIGNLCRWGKKFGVDGFVRMEMAFEVMLCDFSSGVSPISFANIVGSLGLPPDMSATFVVFEALNAGAWHSRLPGETRIHLDLAGLVSFYDTQRVPSLVAVRANQERWDHRVRDISEADWSAAVSRLEAALKKRPSAPSSTINWKTLLQVLVDRYAGRLELTRHLLHTPVTSPQEAFDLALQTQTQLRVTLAPYLSLSAVPTDPADETALDWATPVYRDCARAHTGFLETRVSAMTESERLVLRAIRGTLREVCRVVTKMWVAGVYAGIDPSVNTRASVDAAAVTRVWSAWVEDLDGLMAWLDWSVWIKCEPACGPEETCFIHMWPPAFPLSSVVQKGKGARDVVEEPFRPQPKCISLVDP